MSVIWSTSSTSSLLSWYSYLCDLLKIRLGRFFSSLLGCWLPASSSRSLSFSPKNLQLELPQRAPLSPCYSWCSSLSFFFFFFSLPRHLCFRSDSSFWFRKLLSITIWYAVILLHEKILAPPAFLHVVRYCGSAYTHELRFYLTKPGGMRAIFFLLLFFNRDLWKLFYFAFPIWVTCLMTVLYSGIREEHRWRALSFVVWVQRQVLWTFITLRDCT